MNDTTQEDGGPAFPQPLSYEGGRRDSPVEFGYGGMTLRDYFAAAVIAQCQLTGSTTIEQDAAEAYVIADAMLKARKL
jgi:hypothetical protein